MAGLFTPDELVALRAPHVARAWFCAFDLPRGLLRVHSGIGTVPLAGHDWIGVDDPTGGVLLAISQVQEPRLGSAHAITFTLSGSSLAFLREVRTARREVEGRPAYVWWQMFDQETQVPIGSMKPLFPMGRMTSPAFVIDGIGGRALTLTVESVESAQNFAPGGRWNPAGQRRRVPGDKGLDYVGVDVKEVLK
jgi:hypothetical protein